DWSSDVCSSDLTEVPRRALTEEAPKSLLSLPVGGRMHILNGRQGPDRKNARASGQGEDQHESPPGRGGMLPEAQHPSGSAERKETEAGNDLGSACEIGAPFMLVEPIGNQAIPSRRGELSASIIGGGGAHDE